MSVNVPNLKKKLFSLTGKGIKYDLTRIQNAADEIGSLNIRFSSIHVAGTNGKGSTCTFIESMLRSLGFKTGLFTSPHLIHFEERFRINGEMISERKWVEAFDRIKNVVTLYRLTFFEINMLLACEIFKMENVEWGIFETGMGGRLDATNIIMPKVSVITHIGIDHCEYLGETIEDICKEKLGIVKNSVPVVAAENQKESVNGIICNTCRTKNAPLTSVRTNDASILKETEEGTSFSYKKFEYNLSMSGRFQVFNAMLALEALNAIGYSDTNYKRMYEGLRGAKINGRCQKIAAYGKTIIFDAAHNPDAVTNLTKYLHTYYTDKDLVIIVGIMADKEINVMMQLLQGAANHLIVTKPPVERAADSDHLAQYCSKTKCTPVATMNEALENALARPEKTICVTGSFHTVGEVMALLKNKK